MSWVRTVRARSGVVRVVVVRAEPRIPVVLDRPSSARLSFGKATRGWRAAPVRSMTFVPALPLGERRVEPARLLRVPDERPRVLPVEGMSCVRAAPPRLVPVLGVRS